jgi:hypothetical protein
MDQHIALLLFFRVNLICDSLRSLQRVSQLKKVQRLLGVQRASLGSFSEANRAFDADLLKGLIGELASQLKPLLMTRDWLTWGPFLRSWTERCSMRCRRSPGRFGKVIGTGP